jgi:AGCS family alanine or glycine:cation symporter
MLLGASIYLSMRLKWPQLRHLRDALHRLLAEKKSGGKMGNFAAVATIVGGNLGAGTIAGTALAISTGGPGSILWMVVVAVLGSVIKLSCASLGVFYQEKQHHGRCIGGPMFYIEKGIGWRKMSLCYCVFLIGASLTAGNLVQMHVFASSLSGCGLLTKTVCVLFFMVPVVVVLFGGLRRFAAFMSCSVPIVGIAYIGVCFIGLCMMWDRVGFALKEIFCGAFSLASMGSGTAGIALIGALHAGTSRGLFATDIGLGLAAIAHGNVDGEHLPRLQHAKEQGIIALLAPLLVATLCAITGVLIICAAPNFTENASKICVDTFVRAFGTPHAGWLVPVAIYFFALTTILSWAWFAEHTFFFLRRSSWRHCYRLLFIAIIPVGVFMQTSLPWKIADLCMDGLLLTNLLAILLLRNRVMAIQHSEG